MIPSIEALELGPNGFHRIGYWHSRVWAVWASSDPLHVPQLRKPLEGELWWVISEGGGCV